MVETTSPPNPDWWLPGLLSVLLCLVTGCAISTTYGKHPVLVSTSPRSYQITIYKNALESNAGADRTAEKEIKKLLVEVHCNDYAILSIDRANQDLAYDDLVNKDVYTVKVYHTDTPSQVPMEARVAGLTAEVLLHVNIPRAKVTVMSMKTEKTYGAIADKHGWVVLKLPRATYLFGNVEKNQYPETTTYRFRRRFDVKHTDGVIYAGHVFVSQGGYGRVSYEGEKARAFLRESPWDTETVYEETLEEMK